MTFDIHYAFALVPIILKAAGTTVWVTLVSSALATVIGFGLQLIRQSGRLASFVTTVVVDFLRITPILALLYFFYFVLPFYGVHLPAVLVGVLTFSLHYAGYLAEVFKGAIYAIPKGQTEGGMALGLRRPHIVLMVLLPQIFRNAAPAIGTYVLAILKSTPYLAVLAVPEMLGAAMDQAADSFTYTEPMAVVGILFLVFCFATGRALELVHRHLRRHD